MTYVGVVVNRLDLLVNDPIEIVPECCIVELFIVTVDADDSIKQLVFDEKIQETMEKALDPDT